MSAAKIERIADRLLAPVVVVVSKRTDLRLALQGCEEPALVEHDQIPLLLSAEESRQFDVLSDQDRAWGASRLVNKNVPEKLHEAQHLRPPR